MRSIIAMVVALLSCGILFAQNEKYETAMKENIVQLDAAPNEAKLAELANRFERIADAEKTQWLPYYYAAYCHALHAILEKDKSKTDAIADKAEQLVKKAEEIAGKENSETCVIKSMVASGHMMVSPQTRWQQYGPISGENLKKAKEMDPSNPRPIFLEGQAKFYTPAAFGGGKAAAKELFTKALGMFDSFKPETPLHPHWGKTATQYFLSLTD